MEEAARTSEPRAMSLAGKVAIVTGAGQGIGRAIAKRFVQEGARVVLAERNTTTLTRVATEIKNEGGEVLAAEVDVGQAAHMHRLVEAVQQWERLDILVNTAAWWPDKTLLDTTFEEWAQTLNVSLTGVFHTVKATLPLMQSSGGGSIINLASINHRLASPHMGAYSAAKGGVRALTRQLAVEYGPDKIRCNSLSPGLIVTEVMSLREEERRGYLEAYPLGRLGTVKDVANAAVFLASEASDFVTGIDLVVDGGLTSLSPAAVIAPNLRAKWGRLPVHFDTEDHDD